METPFTEQSMRRIRVVAAVFSVLQLSLVSYTPDAAPFVETLILVVPIGLLMVNAFSLRFGHWQHNGTVQVLADAGLSLAVIAGLGFEPRAALWVLLALPIAEGALRGGLVGALQVWALSMPAYLVVWSWMDTRFGADPIDAPAIAYRAGMLLLLAGLSGSLSESVRRQADALRAAWLDSKRRADLLRTVAATGRRLPVDDLDSLLQAVAEAAMDMGFDAAELALVDAAQQEQRTAVARGLPAEVVEGTRPSDGGLVGAVWRTGRTRVVPNYSVWPDADPELLAVGLRQAVGVPVWVSGRVEGVLCAGWSSERQVSDDEVECLEMLALEVGAALEASRRIDDQMAYAEILQRQARHDPLTGLASRAYLLETLRQRQQSDSLSSAALLFVDLDRFKSINDTYGHAGGDQLLRQVAARMGGAIRPPDLLARFGGDEFVVLLDAADEYAAVKVAERLHESLAQPFVLFGRPVRVSACIGVTGVNTSAEADVVVAQADMAMYSAKERRRPRTVVHDERLQAKVLRRVRLEADLHGVEERGELRLDYQPLYRPGLRRPVGAEALLRWEHQQLGLVQPSEFVALAEMNQCIRPMGWWVLESACAQLVLWRQSVPDFRVWVNVSPQQLTEPAFAQRLSALLSRTGCTGDGLVLELTETPLERDDMDAAHIAMDELHELGIRLMADDFGQESSSLGRLRELPFDGIKIDRALLTSLPESADQFAVVRSITELAHDLRLEVVAEGVERVEQLDSLASAGCDLLQGFSLSRPVPAATLDLLLIESADRSG